MESRRSMLKLLGAGLGGAAVVAAGGFALDRSLRDEGPTGRPGPSVVGNDTSGPLAPNGTAYFVAPDGEDGNEGTMAAPFGTIDRAVEAVEAGDAVVLRRGVHERERALSLPERGGSADARCSLVGYPGERPVVRFDGPTPGGWQADSGVILENAAFWTVENLVVQGSRHVGVKLVGDGTHDVVVANVETVGNYLAGVGVYDGAANNLVTDVWSHDNFDRENDGEDADGIQFSVADDNVVRRAVCFDNSDDGIDLWESRGIVLEDCWCWQNGRGTDGNGNGFKLGGGDRSSGGHTVRRNVAFANRTLGFNQNGAERPMEVYNNTAAFNQGDFVFYDVPHSLRNNISFGGGIEVTGQVDHSHNTWNLGISNPGFESRRPGTHEFLRLLPGSPCIDAGVDVGLTFSGDAPDLGAFEFAPAESTTSD